MNKYLILIIIISYKSFIVGAQYLYDPSFEKDFTGLNNWYHCNYNSTPDFQPGQWNVELPPSDGNRYMGLIMLPGGDADGPKNEDVTTKLLKPLYKDTFYIISIDLAYAPNAYNGGNSPQKFRIAGGNGNCIFEDVLNLTDYITDTIWKRHFYTVKPTLDSITYIKLEIYNQPPLRLLFHSYTVLDNMNLTKIHIDTFPKVCKGQQNVIYQLPQFPCLNSFNWSYSGKGISVIDSSSFMVANFDETATSGTLNLNLITCEGTYGPISILITVDSLPLAAGNILGKRLACSSVSNIYSIIPVKNAEYYNWNYLGTGAILTGNSDSISISFSEIETSGILSVFPVNHCGTGDQSPPLSLEVNPCDISFPNSFSPNGDGKNDLFVIHNLYINSQLVIFDRSGRIVFQSNNYQNDWNGNDMTGNKLPTDTYWYVFTSKYIPNPVKGYIYLKR